MLDILYAILISPIEFVMQLVFERAYVLTDSYGVSILLLSLSITLLASPVYYIADKWKNVEGKITQKLAANIKEIKSVYSGQERYMMLRTLYRQNNYHPIMAIRTSFGFLIQIPFFLAAYMFLGGYENIEGHSFLFFNNLAKPDALISFGGTSINVMPFVMTFINLIAVYIYGKNQAAKENIQLYLVSILFLILLYTAPLALVLYWTSNNIISTLKSMLTSKLAVKKPPIKDKLKRKNDSELLLMKIKEIFLYIGKLIEKISPSKQVIYILLMFTLYNMWLFGSLNVLSVDKGSIEFELYLAAIFVKASILIVLFLSVISFGHFARGFSSAISDWLRISFAIIFLMLFLRFALDYKNAEVMSTGKLLAANMMLYCAILMMIIFVKTPKFLHLFLNSVDNPIYKLEPKLYYASLSLILSVIFVYLPIKLLESDPSVLQDMTLSEFLSQIIIYYVFSLVLIGGVIKLAPVKLKSIFRFFILCLSITTILYSFFFIGNYGAFDAFILQNEGGLHDSLNPIYDAMILGIIVVATYTILARGKSRILFHILLIFQFSILIKSVFVLTDVNVKPILVINKNSEDNGLPSYNKELLSFSKSGTNIVVLMLDGFSGENIGAMSESISDFEKIFDGFIWYPNTLTSGSATLLGEPSIHGGHYYTPTQINKRQIDSLENEIARGYGIFSEEFGKRGFDVSIAGLGDAVVKCELVKQHIPRQLKLCINAESLERDYMTNWQSSNPELAKSYNTKKAYNSSVILPLVALFRASPYSFKKYIYDSADWLGGFDRYSNDLKTVFIRAAFIDSLSNSGNIESQNSTFKYIQSLSTHAPFGLTANCMVNSKSSKYANRDSDETKKKYIQHTACILRSVSKWLSWLKSNDIYDNTKIVIVSDHAYQSGFKRGNALMLVKDINSKGTLSIDNRLLSNADTPSIVCSNIGGCKGVGPDPTKTDFGERTLKIVYGPWSKKSHPIDKYVFEEVYEVTENIFDPLNWKKLNEK